MNVIKKSVPSSGARKFQEKIIRSERPSRLVKNLIYGKIRKMAGTLDNSK